MKAHFITEKGPVGLGIEVPVGLGIGVPVGLGIGV